MDDELWRNLYGLPIYHTKLFGKDGIVVMAGNRPYKDLTSSALSDLLGKQIAGGSDGTVYAGGRKIAEKAEWSLNAAPKPLSGQNVETVFRVGPDGRPEAVTRLVDRPTKGSLRNVGEDEIAWLRRRIDEICVRL